MNVIFVGHVIVVQDNGKSVLSFYTKFISFTKNINGQKVSLSACYNNVFFKVH